MGVKRHTWTPAQIAALMERRYPDRELADMLGISIKTVRTKRWEIKVGNGSERKARRVKNFDLEDTGEL